MYPRFFLALLAVLPAFLFGQARTSDKNIKIISATQETWSPGAVQDNTQPGGGLLYQITAELRRDGTFEFDSLVTAGGSLPVEVVKNNVRKYKGPFKKGESITLIAYQKSLNQFHRNSSHVNTLVSKQRNGSFFISYFVRGKKCLVGTGEIKKKTPGKLNQ